jgi:hypothetical protein
VDGISAKRKNLKIFPILMMLIINGFLPLELGEAGLKGFGLYTKSEFYTLSVNASKLQ